MQLLPTIRPFVATATRRFQAAASLLALTALVTIPNALGQSATTSADPLSDRLVSYVIDVELDPDALTLNGQERLAWRNPSEKPVDELQFHLYLNAFRDSLSTFMVESGGRHRGFSAEGRNKWGGIDINRMVRVSNSGDRITSALDESGEDLTDAIRFIQPDDGNTNDRTVISVPLQTPVQPGETIALDIDFTSKLPKVMARTGWEDMEDGSLFVMAAQWFPKIGVLEVPGQRYIPEDATEAKWNTHQFHANSEFYADFGTFDVSITTPDDFHVGASGVQIEESSQDGKLTRRFKAEDVHDFAWTASPSFRVFTDTWKHVTITLMIRPEHAGQVRRHFDAAKVSLDYYDRWLGEYPYTTLTLVDGVGGSNGMEYPTLITLGTAYGIPSWIRPLELVTIHEFGHQYFYGLLASNEFEEAWLDEGMNSFVEARIMDAEYGPGSVMDFPGAPISDGAFARLNYTESNPHAGALFTKSWEYGPGEYSRNSYSKPATVMRTLENILGSDVMERFLKRYYSEWRFRHPTTRDLQDVFEDVAGQDLDWYFDQFVYGTAVVDFEAGAIQNAQQGDGWTSEVSVLRNADAVIPVDVRISFADGSAVDTTWDAAGTEQTFTFARSAPVTEVFVDPENKIVLEITPLDNRRTTEPSNLYPTKVVSKLTYWIQSLMTMIQALV
ncbi:MAG: M1 family metallopeptidase [Bacteroidetes bacterium]|nr:M1 family metallopeptidase [Bacteroidota bacterium]